MSMTLRAVIGGIVGAGIGLAMYKFVGCRTGACPAPKLGAWCGACPLTANPYVAMFLWGLMGVLVAAGK